MAKRQEPVPLNCYNILVISLGCAASKNDPEYSADIVNEFSKIDWIFRFKTLKSPVLQMLGEGSVAMVDYHATVLFEYQGAQNNYLRIQDDQIDPSVDKGDDSSTETMTKLKEIGVNLLSKYVSRIDLLSGNLVPDESCVTNAGALKRFAKILSDERKLRLAKV